jgi:Polyketide cyclase / dehydrase and lipid transport
MKRISAARRFEVPLECGFAFITNTENWSRFWPGYVRLERGSRWGASGDTARLVTRLFGRERELALTLTTFEPNRLVAYTSTQPGLPDAYHERHFEGDADGFVYRLVVDYEPRPWIAWIFDSMLLPHAIRRAFERTFTALEQEFRRSHV